MKKYNLTTFLSLLLMLGLLTTVNAQYDDMYYQSDSEYEVYDADEDDYEDYAEESYEDDYVEVDDEYYQYTNRLRRFRTPYRTLSYYDVMLLNNLLYSPYNNTFFNAPLISINIRNRARLSSYDLYRLRNDPFYSSYYRFNRYNTFGSSFGSPFGYGGAGGFGYSSGFGGFAGAAFSSYCPPSYYNNRRLTTVNTSAVTTSNRVNTARRPATIRTSSRSRGLENASSRVSTNRSSSTTTRVSPRTGRTSPRATSTSPRTTRRSSNISTSPRRSSSGVSTSPRRSSSSRSYSTPRSSSSSRSYSPRTRSSSSSRSYSPRSNSSSRSVSPRSSSSRSSSSRSSSRSSSSSPRSPK